MRIAIVIALVAGFIWLAIATTIEGPFAILFGWIAFLWRVLPEVQPDGPSVVVGALALLMFGVGVHWIGRSLRGSTNPAGKWRVRWTIAVVLGVVLLFTAGISIVGISHQVAWLATSDQPLIGKGISRNDTAEGRLKMIGVSVMNYEWAQGDLPPSGTFAANGEALHSWETHLLPWMSYSGKIDMNRPWNDPENERTFKCIVPEFINPAYRTPPLEDGNGFGLSHYAANSRAMPVRVLPADKSEKPPARAENTRGTSNLILVGEVNAGYKPWGHPVNARDPTTGLSGGVNNFGGPTKHNGTTFVMADGSVRFIGNGVDPDVLRALSNPRE